MSQVGADSLPIVSTIHASEQAVHAMVDHVRIVTGELERSQPLAAERGFA